MKFESDLIGKPFFEIAAGSDGTFTMKVAKALVTEEDAGSFPLSIVLSDALSP